MRLMAVPIRAVAVALLAAVVCVASGCKPDDEIRSYSVPKEPTAKEKKPDTPPDGADKVRMRVAVVPTNDGYFWTVRFLAPTPVVDQYSADFDALVDSLKLPATSQGRPTFTIPAGWREGTAPSKMAADLRVVTLHTGPKEKPVEMYVSTPVKEDLLGNVNRWRVQFVGLRAVTEAELKDLVQERTVDGRKVTLIDLRGPGAANPGGGMGGGPFSGK
jgi:hypothetical protein